VAQGRKTGGRTAGTLNRSTAKLKTLLDEVFDEAFASPTFKRTLVRQITTLKIDRTLLTTLLHYYAGRPAQAVDHTHRGTLTLAELITGAVPDAEPEE
jgi:hypothetical protein